MASATGAESEATAVARVGETEYDDILTALENWTDGTTLTLLSDIEAGRITEKIKIERKTVTLDLNGRTVSSNSSYFIYRAGGSITIRDSVGGGNVVDYISGSNLIIEGGSYEMSVGGSNLTITGGEFAYVAVTTGESATISGGSFDRIRIYSEVGTLDDMLAEGYCFYDKDGNVVDTSEIQIVSYWYNLYDVTVGKIE